MKNNWLSAVFVDLAAADGTADSPAKLFLNGPLIRNHIFATTISSSPQKRLRRSRNVVH